MLIFSTGSGDLSVAGAVIGFARYMLWRTLSVTGCRSDVVVFVLKLEISMQTTSSRSREHYTVDFDTPTPAATSLGARSSNQLLNLAQTASKPRRALERFSSLASIQSMPRSSVFSPGRSPSALHVDISLDGSEKDRRTLEQEIRTGLGESATSGSADGFDENSARFGDRQPAPGTWKRFKTHAKSGSSSSSDSSDDNHSLRIGLRSHREPLGKSPVKNNKTYSAHTSPAATPYRQRAAQTSRSAVYESPMSGFDGMAAELRKAFERIGAGTRPAQYSPDNVKEPRAELHSSVNNGRRVLGEIGNAVTGPAPREQAPQKAAPEVAYSRAASLPKHSPAKHLRASTSSDHEDTLYRLPDITGLTEGLASPERGRGHLKVQSIGQAKPGALDLQILGDLRLIRKRKTTGYKMLCTSLRIA